MRMVIEEWARLDYYERKDYYMASSARASGNYYLRELQKEEASIGCPCGGKCICHGGSR